MCKQHARSGQGIATAANTFSIRLNLAGNRRITSCAAWRVVPGLVNVAPLVPGSTSSSFMAAFNPVPDPSDLSHCWLLAHLSFVILS